MTSLKRWRQIGQGQFHKWETPGEEFEGTWRGIHDGRFGPLGTLETPEGLITFPLHAALLERLKLVREGAEVLIDPLICGVYGGEMDRLSMAASARAFGPPGLPVQAPQS